MGGRVPRRLAHVFRQHAIGELGGEPLAVRGARFVGGLHHLLQRKRVERPAGVGERLHKPKAEGDQRAACRRRRVERDDRTVVRPQDGRPPRHAIVGKIGMGEVARRRAAA